MVQFDELFFSLDTENLHEVISNNRVVFPVIESSFNITEVQWSAPGHEYIRRDERDLLPCWGIVTEEEELFWKHPLSHLFGYTKFEREDESLLEHRAYFNRDSSLSFYAQGSAWNGAVDWMVVSTTKQSDDDALAVWCHGHSVITDIDKLFIYRPDMRAHISREFGTGTLKLIVPTASMDWLADHVVKIGERVVEAYTKMLEADKIQADRVLTNTSVYSLLAQFMFSQLVPSPYLRTLLYAGLDAHINKPGVDRLSIAIITEATQLFHALLEDNRFVAAMHQAANELLPVNWASNHPTI